MNDFDFKEEIKKLLKGKREENYLFYYGERFYVSRSGNIRFITLDAVNPLIRNNPGLEVWHIVKYSKGEMLPSILAGLKVTTITISDA
jgi:hypothetical protein